MEEMRLKCTNGILIVYEDRVIISRNTAMGFLTQGAKGDKVFFYKNLSSVEYRKPTIWANGYIKFIISGAIDIGQRQKSNNIMEMATQNDLVNDSNSLILRAFNKKVPEESEKIYKYILTRMEYYANLDSNATVNQLSSADEILKFKKLLDDGIITQEEFNKKKNELLN